MVDQFNGWQFSAWLFVALLFVVAGWLVSKADSRGELLAERWQRFASWLEAHGRSEDDEDELFVRSEIRRVAREERLYADLARLRQLVATDTYMSATRQLGNRMAYRQLLVEAGALAVQPRPLPPDRRWAIERADLATTRRAQGPETLDVRWR